MRLWIVILVIAVTLSMSINILEPINQEIKEGGTYNIGKVGAGQAFSVVVERETKTGGKLGRGGYYDYAYAFDLPEGWNSKPSPLYANPLQIIIKTSPNAEEKEYKVGIKLVDEKNIEGLGNKTFYITMRIIYDVMDAYLEHTVVDTGVGQPIRNVVYVKNKADIGDIFIVEMSVGKNRFYKEVFVPANSERPVVVEGIAGEEGQYTGFVKIYSKESPQVIKKELVFKVNVKSTIEGDINAVENGVLLFFPHEQLIYSTISVISNLFGIGR